MMGVDLEFIKSFWFMKLFKGIPIPSCCVCNSHVCSTRIPKVCISIISVLLGPRVLSWLSRTHYTCFKKGLFTCWTLSFLILYILKLNVVFLARSQLMVVTVERQCAWCLYCQFWKNLQLIHYIKIFIIPFLITLLTQSSGSLRN